jgi:voltage-gated potassium channel
MIKVITERHKRVGPMSITSPKQLKKIHKRFQALLRLPLFWIVTIAVNSLALIGTFTFHYFEYGQNEQVTSLLDSFGWSVGLITTVGFGNVVPVTTEGKLLSIFMMIIGSIVLWTYMAFFVSAFIAPELSHLEHEIEDVERDLKVALKKDEKI